MSVWVGLDVAAKTFEMVCRREGKSSRPLSYKQSPEGHAQAVKRLHALKPTCVVLEATGIYYLDLAMALAAGGLPVAVINPRSYRHFAELKLVTSKTDGIDATLLAEYAERMTPSLWSPPDVKRLAVRDIGRQINRLTRSRSQAKNRLHALQAKRMTLALLIEDEQEGIALLDRRLERLREAALALISESVELSAQLQHLVAASGVGLASAIALLGELCVLPSEMKSGQVSRHAGLDVRLCKSGTSVERPARLSKAGNAYLRAALYMPALVAVRHDERAKAFYERLVSRGKKKIQALCAVMRKYLTGLWACLRSGTPFDSAKLFGDCHLEKS